MKPTLKIVQNGDDFEVETNVPFRTIKNKYTIGQEFVGESLSGAKDKVCNKSFKHTMGIYAWLKHLPQRMVRV